MEIGEESPEIDLEPSRTATISIVYDPVAEPDFRGHLSVDVEGSDHLGQTVFRTVVKLEVPED